MANRVLIITGEPADAEILSDALKRTTDGPFDCEWVNQLAEGLERLSQGGVDAILADLSLPDSQGIETFDRLFAVAPDIPIMTLSALDDDALATESVKHGAQGVLSKGHFKSSLMPQSLRNIILRKAVEDASFIDKARAETTLNSISDAVICTDLAANVDYLNAAAEAMTGWTLTDARGHPIAEVMQIVQGETREIEQNPIELVLKDDKPKELAAGTILIRRGGGEVVIEDSASPIHDPRGRVTGAVIVFHDVTAAQQMATKMAFLAQHDALTKLPNRVLLNDRIAQAIALARRRASQLAVLFIDLDKFKPINDSLGHAIGDKLLQSVAQRLTDCVRSSDTVSRQGGDEFVILLSQDKLAEDAALTAAKILVALEAAYSISGNELHISASIGISTYPADGETAESLIKSADTAMYHAKQEGRNNYQFFQHAMNLRAIERQAIEVGLRGAIGRQEFELYFQSKVELATKEIVGSEALLRWNHPTRGLMLPAGFVRIAEECGMIVEIGRWVLRAACLQVKQWEDAGLRPGSIAINVSAREFRHKDFVEGVRLVLSETGLTPGHLQLEITEGILMHEAKASSAILRQLKTMGVSLAVDDFGTGYSSLSYLTQFPIDVLKIDQSFVQAIGSGKSNGVIDAVIAMGNSLNQQVVAEGVEDQRQLDFLNTRRCKEGQGYLFGRPVAAEKFAERLWSEHPGIDGGTRPEKYVA